MSLLQVNDTFFSTIKQKLIDAGIVSASQQLRIEDIIKILSCFKNSGIDNYILKQTALKYVSFNSFIPTDSNFKKIVYYVEFIGSGYIPMKAFQGNTNMKKIEVPEFITNCGGSMFLSGGKALNAIIFNCGEIAENILNGINTTVSKNVFISSNTKILGYLGLTSSNVEKFTIYTDRLEDVSDENYAYWNPNWNTYGATVHYGVSLEEFKETVDWENIV